MLGFGGHFATKSRRYSTTHKALRAQRREWQRSGQLDWRTRHHDDVDACSAGHGPIAEGAAARELRDRALAWAATHPFTPPPSTRV